MKPSDPITELLSNWSDTAKVDASQLTQLIYSQMRRVAAGIFKREKPGHLLQPTALIHETYIRLLKTPRGGWKSREHFFGVAARSMRQILIEHARAQGSIKRGGSHPQQVPLDSVPDYERKRSAHLLSLDAALERLSSLDPRQARMVELRFFAGLSRSETARVLGVSEATVKKDWTLARAWLKRELVQHDTRVATDQTAF